MLEKITPVDELENQKDFVGLTGVLVPKALASCFYPPESSKEKKEFLTLLGRKIARYLEEIPGITRFIFIGYTKSVNISKGDAFDWEDIEPQVLHILETLINDPDAELFLEKKTLPLKCVAKDCFYRNQRKYSFNRIIFNDDYCWDSFYSSLESLENPLRDIARNLLNPSMVNRVSFGLYTITIRKLPENKWIEVEKFLKPIFEELIKEPVSIVNR